MPQVYPTSEYRVVVVELANGLASPWSIAILPDGEMLITERAGRLRIYSDGAIERGPIGGVPEVRVTLIGGLLDLLLHPRFAENGRLYLSYSKGGEGNLATTAIARARLDGRTLTDVEEIFVAENWSASPTNFGGRMVFGSDGHLYMAVGERQEPERAQDPMVHGGKVVRLREDGSVPDDNPPLARIPPLVSILADGSVYFSRSSRRPDRSGSGCRRVGHRGFTRTKGAEHDEDDRANRRAESFSARSR